MRYMPRPSHSFHGEDTGNQKVATSELAFERHVGLLQDNLGGGDVKLTLQVAGGLNKEMQIYVPFDLLPNYTCHCQQYTYTWRSYN